MLSNLRFRTIVCFIIMCICYSCSKNNHADTALTEPISEDVLTQISKLGFNTGNVIKSTGGYIVEGDIFLSASELATQTSSPSIRLGETEQYRTNNLVRSLPRTITISLTNLPAAYTASVDAAIARYNQQNLRIIFQRVANSGTIVITGVNLTGPDAYLGLSGFPSGTGNPYNSINLNFNAGALGANPPVDYLTTVIAHEMGHCIGFRHTDYMNRGYSGCFVDASHPSNEGAGSDGALLMPCTPASPDANSWMLACIGYGVNRPFNVNDRIALHYLYQTPSATCGSVDKRVISGVCQTAVRCITSENYDPLHNRCTIGYYNRWSDGEIDGEFDSVEAGQCP